MKKVDELLQQLNAKRDEMRGLLDADKVVEAKSVNEEIRSLKEKIELQKELDEAEEREVENKIEKRGNIEMEGKIEYRDSFYKYIVGQELNLEEKRALSEGTASAGGYTVPKSFQKKLIDKLAELNIMRRLANVIQTDTDTDIPMVSTHGSADWTAEAVAFNESDETFAQITIKAYKLTRIVKISEELLQDSAFDLETYLVNEFARSISKAEENAFIVGDGTGKPQGVFVGASAGVTAASTSAITADEIIDLYYSLGRAYRQNAVFILNDSTMKAIRKLKDSNGDYLVVKGLAGEAETLLSRPVYTSEFAASINADAKVIAFGDMSYYTIADRKARVFQRLNELYAGSGQIGFRAYERVDGKLTLAEAVKVLKMAAV